MDKVELILKEVERLKDKGKYKDTYDYAFRDGNNAVCDQLLHFINSLLKEPSKVWHDANEEPPMPNKPFAVIEGNGELTASYTLVSGGMTWDKIKEVDGIIKWAYTDDLFNLYEEPKFRVEDYIRNKKDGYVTSIESIDDKNYYVSKCQAFIPIYKQDEWKLYENSVSEELESASQKYAEENHVCWDEPIESVLSGTPRTREANDKLDIKDAFKDGAKWKEQQIPHWKKATLPNTPWGINSDNLTCPDGYYIELEELRKLPKDE